MKKNLKTKELKKESSAAWVLFLGTALVTLFFNPNIQDPFNTPKMVVLLLTSSWLFGFLLKTYLQNSLIKKSFEYLLVIIVSIFIFFIGFAFMFTDQKIVGLIGDTQRRNGLLSYSALSVFMLCAARLVKPYLIKRFLIISILTGLPLSTYGIVQILGYDLIPWDNPYNSMIGTLGNPNFASALLALLGFISFSSMFTQITSGPMKFIAFLTGILSVIAILQSESRQGLISLCISLLVFLSLYSYVRSKLSGGILIFSTITLLFLGILGMLQKGPLQEVLYKNSVSVRGYYWRAGLEMLKAHPLTGVGLDSYNWYFKQYREPGYSLTYGYNITSSNAHNTIIQLFATGGTFVGLAYLSLILLILFCGLQNIRKLPKNEKTLPIILFAAWIGFQSQSFVSIDNLGIAVWGWVIGGLIIGYSKNALKISEFQENSNQIPKNNLTLASDTLQPIVSIFFVTISLVISVLLIQAESETYKARSYATMNNPTGQEIVRNSYKKLTANPLADPYYKFILAQSLIDSGLELEGYNEIKKLLLQDPINLAYLNSIAYHSEILQEVEVAKNSRLRIAALDPWNLRNLFLLAEIYVNQGELINARQLFNQIIFMGPGTEEAKLSKNNLEVL